MALNSQGQSLAIIVDWWREGFSIRDTELDRFAFCEDNSIWAFSHAGRTQQHESVMNVIALKALRDFWSGLNNANAEIPLRAWYQTVRRAKWNSFADVRQTFGSADLVGDKTVFNVGGNEFRIITFIDFESGRVYVRYVLTHKEYDQGNWKNDTFGENWQPFSEHTKSSRKNKRRKK